MSYRLNGSVLHRDPAFEECNLDDSQRDESIDDETGAALVSIGNARPCEHCFPDGQLHQEEGP